MSRAITVTIREVKGSAPRAAGTAMQISQTGQSGSIGGGALEWEATRIARDMLRDGAAQTQRTMPLGPDLGQCCGGTVVLDFSANGVRTARDHVPLWIWGAGHVGRALVTTLSPLDFDITWVDTATNRFPEDTPANVAPLVASDPTRVVSRAPQDVHHYVLTYSHDIDLKLCDAVLRHGFAQAGLIGSATKWARFRKRLSALGHADSQIDRITCPIGDPALGKHPQAIAIGVAASLLNQSLPATQGVQPR